MAGRKRTVKWQHLGEYKSRKRNSGESSPYHDWVDAGVREDGERREFPEGNPDILPEQDPPEENLTRRLLKEGLRKIKFSYKERQVLSLLAQGMTQEDAAKYLNISRSRVAQAILRIQKKGRAWYGNKTAQSSRLNAEEENS